MARLHAFGPGLASRQRIERIHHGRPESRLPISSSGSQESKGARHGSHGEVDGDQCAAVARD